MLVVPLLWAINVGVIAREECYLERKFGNDLSSVQEAGEVVGLITQSFRRY